VEARRVVAGLVGLLRREYGWWDRFDPAVFARHASAEQWQSVDAYTEAAAGFLHEARTARK
jgi:ParB family chromosome partitioning protein